MNKQILRKRFLAFLIDLLLFSIILSTIYFSLIIYYLVTRIDFSKLFPYFVSSNFIIFIFLILKDIVKGQSLGKKVLKISIRGNNTENTPPSLFKLLIRNILLVIWPIELVVILFRADNKRLGDMITNTIVIDI